MSEQEVEPAPLGMPSQDSVDSNAGEDAVMGTVAEEPPTDIGGQKPMDEGLDEGFAPQPDPEPRDE